MTTKKTNINTDTSTQRLKELYPDCVVTTTDSEGRITEKIDFVKLQQTVQSPLVDTIVKYEFNWEGKQDSVADANRPGYSKLIPCPEESVDWDTTENLYIEGDSLEVLKNLQDTYQEKVKMIYIDPPYNTGKKFIYNDNFKRPKRLDKTETTNQQRQQSGAS